MMKTPTEMSAPFLLFTIDVEEDMPGWQITDPLTVGNVQALPRLAESCAEIGVQPTYLCDYPVATDTTSAATLRELHALNDWALRDIGIHRGEICEHVDRLLAACEVREK